MPNRIPLDPILMKPRINTELCLDPSVQDRVLRIHTFTMKPFQSGSPVRDLRRPLIVPLPVVEPAVEFEIDHAPLHKPLLIPHAPAPLRMPFVIHIYEGSVGCVARAGVANAAAVNESVFGVLGLPESCDQDMIFRAFGIPGVDVAD